MGLINSTTDFFVSYFICYFVSYFVSYFVCYFVSYFVCYFVSYFVSYFVCSYCFLVSSLQLEWVNKCGVNVKVNTGWYILQNDRVYKLDTCVQLNCMVWITKLFYSSLAPSHSKWSWKKILQNVLGNILRCHFCKFGKLFKLCMSTIDWYHKVALLLKCCKSILSNWCG